MGKGGYLGGSTILYLQKKREDNLDNSEYKWDGCYKCEICQESFSYTTYFNHLRVMHKMKGCIYCGHPYKYDGGLGHTCERCGRFIRLKNQKTEKRKPQKRIKKQREINHGEKKSNSQCLVEKKGRKKSGCSVGRKDTHLRSIKSNKKQNIAKYKNKNNRRGGKFGVSIKDALEKAASDVKCKIKK